MTDNSKDSKDKLDKLIFATVVLLGVNIINSDIGCDNKKVYDLPQVKQVNSDYSSAKKSISRNFQVSKDSLETSYQFKLDSIQMDYDARIDSIKESYSGGK